MAAAKFIERGGRQVFRQPFAANGVNFYGFLIDADYSALQKNICDKYLNIPSGGTENFQPAGPFALLVFNTIDSLQSMDEPDHDKGWFSEKEAAVWLLLEDKKRNKLFWFHPYIFVDNSYAMAMGRELYGFPKSIGWFDIPSEPKDANKFSLETIVLDKYDPKTKGTKRELFKINQTDPKGHTFELKSIEEIMKGVLHLFKSQNSLIDDLILSWHTAADLLHGRAPMTFLKQFPDVSNPDLACYQSILEVPSKMTKFHTGGLLHGKYKITIGDYNSHPVRSDLGISAETLEPLMSYYVKFDFEIGNGSVIWQS